MAEKLTPKEMADIVAHQKPGFEVEPQSVDSEEHVAMADRSHVDANAPDLAYLTAKFLKTPHDGGYPQVDSESASSSSQIVQVRPAGGRSADAAGTGESKVVVVSAKERKIVAEQG